MPRQNRVDPWGTICAVPERGQWMGNRGGPLHDHVGRIVRNHVSKAWIYCVLSYKDIRREVMRPGSYTELFFLDEATAFAAGHRPCAMCQRAKYREFIRLWTAAYDRETKWSAPEIDAQLDFERRTNRNKKSHALPSEPVVGMMVECDGQAFRYGIHGWSPWNFGGYGDPIGDLPSNPRLLTPPSLVKILSLGFAFDI